MQYVSLMSAGWSGSTLISMLVCSQPRVAGFGDTYFDASNSPHDLCTCGMSFLQCPVRRAIEDYARRNGMPAFAWTSLRPLPMPRRLPPQLARWWPLGKNALLPALRAMPPLLRKATFRRYYRETQLMLGALKELGEHEVYFDGCKSLGRIELLRTELPRLKVVHSVRHPGAYLYHFARFGEFKLARRLAGWIRYQKRARQYLQLLGPEAYMLITYEDVVSQPSQILRGLAGFLGLSSVEDSEPVRVARARVHILGNAMRESSTEIINMANNWRGRLDPVWERAAGEALRQEEWLAKLYPNG